jgi:hypothetical protein
VAVAVELIRRQLIPKAQVDVGGLVAEVVHREQVQLFQLPLEVSFGQIMMALDKDIWEDLVKD